MDQDSLKVRQFVNLYIAFIAVLSCLLFERVIHFDRAWTVADWLINYQGGFIRRGLAGECFFQLHRFLHIQYNLSLTLVLLSLSGIVLAQWRETVLRSSLQPWVIATLIDPGTLSFGVLDCQAGFHKELLLIASFSLLTLFLIRTSLSDAALTCLLLAFGIVTVLCHEASIFFVPYLFPLIHLFGRKAHQALKIFVFSVTPALFVALISSRFSGSVATASAICTSLGYRLDQNAGHEVCDNGAIHYLTVSPADAYRATLHIIEVHHFLLLYSLFAALSFAPLIFGVRRLAADPRTRHYLAVCIAAAGVSFLLCIPLFLIAIDWGRWIHIHTMLLASLLLTLDAKQRKPLSMQPFTGSERLVPAYGRGICVVLLVYATGWMLPMVYLSQPLRGYYGTAQQLASSFHIHAFWKQHS